MTQFLAVRTGGQFEYLIGGTGFYAGPDVPARDSYDWTTFNPVDYSPIVLGSWDLPQYTNARVGIYGPDTITTAVEGSSGTITFSTAGQIISNTVFYCRVSLQAKVFFNNCLFLGSAEVNGNRELVSMTNGSAEGHFTDCTFGPPQAPQFNQMGITTGTGKLYLTRCDIYSVEDGIHSGTTGASDLHIYQSALHHLQLMSPHPQAAGGVTDNASHSDLIHINGGVLEVVQSGLHGFYDMKTGQSMKMPVNTPDYVAGVSGQHVFGNKYTLGGLPDTRSTSCCMFTGSTALYADFTDVWITGGAAAINWAGRTALAPGHANFTRVKWGPDSDYRIGQAMTHSIPSGVTMTSCTRYDGTPVTVADM